MKLQKEQQLILDTTNKDIIVSAGAGSGKTFVMIEKILDNILNNHVSVTQLLVVTFTNAAATEMRQKLEKRLREYLLTQDMSSDNYKFVLEQINLLPQSNICTLHKFCQNIISKYFYVLDIDTGFNILDDSDAQLLQNRAIDDVLTKLERTEEKPLVDLLYIYDVKRDNQKIKDILFKVYAYLANQPDVPQFCQDVLDAYTKPLDDNVFCNIINDYIVNRADEYALAFKELILSAQQQDYPKVVVSAQECQNVALLFKKDNKFTQHVHLLFSDLVNLPKTPTLSQNEVDKQELKEAFQEIRNKFSKELADWRDCCITDNEKTLSDDLYHNCTVMQSIFTLTSRYKERFDELKRKRNVVDFNDLEHMCLQILSHPDIASEVQQSFRSVYVDEYQDINNIQEKIISFVCTERNLFLVGDVKQSIYGFRNTNPQIFLRKVKEYDQEKQSKASIELNCNFRSDQRVLDFVNLVFSNLMTVESAGLDYVHKSLMASHREYDVPNTPLFQVELDIVNTHVDDKPIKPTVDTVYSVKNAETVDMVQLDVPKSEADIIADKINLLITQQKQIFDPKLGKDGGTRDIKYSDIAILCRSRSDAISVILERLRERGIPVENFGGEDLFASYEIQLLYNYLRLLNNKNDDLALTTLLSSPIINMDEEEMLAIRRSCADKKFFYECLDSVNDEKIVTKLNKLDEYIDMGRHALINGTIFDCLNSFVEATNLESIISLLPEGQSRVDNINIFINHFVGKSYNTCLFTFIDFVESNGGQLKLDKQNSMGDNVVKVVTMHQSKGLEYPIVFLANLGQKFNTDDQKDEILFFDDLGIGLYAYDYSNRQKRNTLARQAIIIKRRERALAENLRLLYVAMTRAKNNLYCVGSMDTAKFTPATSVYELQKCSNFLELILSSIPEITINWVQKSHLALKLIDHLTKAEKHIFDLNMYPLTIHKAKNSEILTNPIKLSEYVPEFEQLVYDMSNFRYKFDQSTQIGLKNSVTALNQQIQDEDKTNINDETQAFALNERRVETGTALGIIYHKAMQLIDFNLDSPQDIYQFLSDKMDVDELKSIDCDKILACLRSLRPLVNQADEVLREQNFMLYIPYNQLIDSKTADKILVQGTIDLVLIKGNEAILLDYKLTNVKNPQQLAQKYALQLKCYATAIQNSKGVKVVKKILYSFLQEMQIIV